MSSNDADFVMSELENHKRGTFYAITRLERTVNKLDVDIKLLDHEMKETKRNLNHLVEQLNKLRPPRSYFETGK